MTVLKYSEFAAGDSFLGYIYQCEYALFHLLDRDKPISQVSIETLDDIVLGDLSDPQALLQLKLHGPNQDGVARHLTDRSADLWKTIRVWSTLIRDNRIDPSATAFFLLTTSPLNSRPGIDHWLAPPKEGSSRDVKRAAIELQRIANEILATPGLAANNPIISAASIFLSLSEQQRHDLVRNFVIVTGSPTIADLRQQIDNRLRASGCTIETHQGFVETIVGWWYRQCVNCLDAKDGRVITFEALERKMAETAKSLILPGLPHYTELEQAPDENQVATFLGWLFVRQLLLLGLKPENELVASAIVDFYKADGHRKKWLEELRLDRLDLSAFESDIRGIWATNFGLAQTEVDSCQAGPDPLTALQRLGLRVLQQTITAKLPTLRGFEGDYLGRGSLHIMANGPAPNIGWHPNWKVLLGGGGEG